MQIVSRETQMLTNGIDCSTWNTLKRACGRTDFGARIELTADRAWRSDPCGWTAKQQKPSLRIGDANARRPDPVCEFGHSREIFHAQPQDNLPLLSQGSFRPIEQFR